MTAEKLRPTQKSEGTTKTERYLARLGNKTFLSLWSYPNVYTPEGRKNGKGQGTELCDLLVVCGNDVLLFSDKDIKYPTHDDPVVAWKRWKKKSIDKSIAQLYGAEQWIKKGPNELFLDATCTVPFPLDLSDAGLKVHLIAVTNNSYLPAQTYFGQGSSGSFVLFPNAPDAVIADKPFWLNNPSCARSFVHVLDEVTLNRVLQELDTLFDFVGYLRAKEEALRRGILAEIMGEEDLLAYYIKSGGLDTHAIDFPPGTHDKYDSVIISEWMWPDYVNSGLQQAIHAENWESYIWDELIEHFAKHILDGTAVSYDKPLMASHEGAIRYLAREGRLARRQLSAAFADKMRTVPHDRRSSRAVPSPSFPDTLFLFVFFPRDPGENYEKYRLERLDLMHAYAVVAKYKYSKFSTFVVIATEPKESDGRSEDCMAMDIDSLDDEMLALAKELQEKDRIFSDLSEIRLSGSRISPLSIHRKKQGRNEPCACGSGKKAKKCCLT